MEDYGAVEGTNKITAVVFHGSAAPLGANTNPTSQASFGARASATKPSSNML
jgi:hypothetical protein